LPPVRCASAGAERRGGVLCAGPAYVVIPQAGGKAQDNWPPARGRRGGWGGVGANSDTGDPDNSYAAERPTIG
jgi:hypothetical protein